MTHYTEANFLTIKKYKILSEKTNTILAQRGGGTHTRQRFLKKLFLNNVIPVIVYQSQTFDCNLRPFIYWSLLPRKLKEQSHIIHFASIQSH